MPDNFLHPWTKKLEKSFVQQALEVTANSDIISFSLGRPDQSLLGLLNPNNIPSDILSPQNLQYSPPSYELKKHIVKLMKERGVDCKEEEIFLTSGAQQAMSLLTKVMTHENDTILVDQLTYPGFIQVNQSLNTKLVPIPCDIRSGIILDELEKLLNCNPQPRFIYMIPEGHNPLGISLGETQRIQLIKLAQKYQIPIVEDDAYGLLTYETTVPPLKSYWKEGVFYIGSFSKVLAPSFRVGWIVTPKTTIERFETLKEGTDINTSTFSQKLILSILNDTDFDAHVMTLRESYKKKRNIMVNSLKKYIPELEFEIPQSGFFLWGTLPSTVNTTELFNVALREEGISFLPGEAFLIGERADAKNSLRLSFAFCPIERIEEGVKRLAYALQKVNNAALQRMAV